MIPLVAASLSLSLKATLKPQPLPTFLEPYDEKALKLTEAALGDNALKVTRGIAYGPAEHQTLDVWAPAARPSSSWPRLPAARPSPIDHSGPSRSWLRAKLLRHRRRRRIQAI